MECKLEDNTIHYEMIGEGRPLVMLHGWPADHRRPALLDGLFLVVPVIRRDAAKSTVPY